MVNFSGQHNPQYLFCFADKEKRMSAKKYIALNRNKPFFHRDAQNNTFAINYGRLPPIIAISGKGFINKIMLMVPPHLS